MPLAAKVKHAPMRSVPSTTLQRLEQARRAYAMMSDAQRAAPEGVAFANEIVQYIDEMSTARDKSAPKIAATSRAGYSAPLLADIPAIGGGSSSGEGHESFPARGESPPQHGEEGVTAENQDTNDREDDEDEDDEGEVRATGAYAALLAGALGAAAGLGEPRSRLAQWERRASMVASQRATLQPVQFMSSRQATLAVDRLVSSEGAAMGSSASSHFLAEALSGENSAGASFGVNVETTATHVLYAGVAG